MLAAKLRRAMVDSDRNPLSELVEIDETSLLFRIKKSTPASGAGRSHESKMLVVDSIEVDYCNMSERLRLNRIANYGADSLNKFIAQNYTTTSIVKTNGWSGYANVPLGTHAPHVIGNMAANVVLPWIHQMFSNLKG